LLLFEVPLTPGAFFRVPSTRDSALVGTWRIPSDARHRSVGFLANGTYRIDGLWSMSWGTRGGVLYAKCRSAGEGWDTAIEPYRVSGDGRAIEFTGKPTFMVPSLITRSYGSMG